MILTVIQARMSSERLPGKVLKPMAGKPMLAWVIEAAQKAQMTDAVVVATSDRIEDKAIVDYATDMVDVASGDLDDVLLRYYQVAVAYRPTHMVRLTGDCPLMDPRIIDETVVWHLLGNHDYTCNWEDGPEGRTHGTDGHDVEVFTYPALVRAMKLAPAGREHVTPFMRESGLFDVGQYLERPTITEKLSVDTGEDFERVEGMLCMGRVNDS